MKALMVGWLVVGCLMLMGPVGMAGTLAQLESRVLGDGWFEYQLTMFQDQYFTTQMLTQCVVPCTNLTEYGPVPLNWAITNQSTHLADWRYQLAAPQTMPYQAVFTTRSASTNWVVSTNFMILGLLWPKEIPNHPCGVVSENWAFFMKLAALIPSDFSVPEKKRLPSAPDRAPAYLRATAEVLPDIALAPGAEGTIHLSWYTNATVRMQQSTDLWQWQDLDVILTTPQTVWTSPAPGTLDGAGYRAQLVAFGHGAGKRAAALAPAAKLLHVRFVEEAQVEVAFESVPGQVYEVRAMDLSGVEKRLATCTATGARSVVRMDAAALPSVGGLVVR